MSLPEIHAGGELRRLGTIIAPPTRVAFTYGDGERQPMFARSEWPAMIAAYSMGWADPHLPPVADQG